MQSVNNYVSRLRSAQLNWLSIISSGLTFLYFVEIGLGIRTIAREDSERYDAGRVYENSNEVKFYASIAFITTATGFTNLVSLNWEYKRKKSAASCYVFHLFQLGIVWRRGALSKGEEWELDSQLLATAKFVHSYFHTVPLVSLQLYDIMRGESRESLAVVAVELFCVVASTIACCWIYGVSCREGRPEITDDQSCGATFLVPVLLPSSDENGKPQNDELQDTKDMFCRYLMSAQMYCFVFGKIIAISSLFVVFGVYSLLAIAIQFFFNIGYLKYQMAYLVPETASGHKKWARFCYLSYLLLFDWHFNRDPNTAFNLCSETRAGVAYYILSIVEVIFVTVISFINDHSSETLNLLVIGTVLVVTSVFSQVMLLLYFRILTRREGGGEGSFFANVRDIRVLFRGKRMFSFLHSSRRTSAPPPAISTIDGCLAKNEAKVAEGSSFTNSYLDFKDLEDSVAYQFKRDDISSIDLSCPAEKPFETLDFRRSSAIFSHPRDIAREEEVIVHNPSVFEAVALTSETRKHSPHENLLWDEVPLNNFNRNSSMSWPSRGLGAANFKHCDKTTQSNSFCNLWQCADANCVILDPTDKDVAFENLLRNILPANDNKH